MKKSNLFVCVFFLQRKSITSLSFPRDVRAGQNEWEGGGGEAPELAPSSHCPDNWPPVPPPQSSFTGPCKPTKRETKLMGLPSIIWGSKSVRDFFGGTPQKPPYPVFRSNLLLIGVERKRCSSRGSKTFKVSTSWIGGVRVRCVQWGRWGEMTCGWKNLVEFMQGLIMKVLGFPTMPQLIFFLCTAGRKEERGMGPTALEMKSAIIQYFRLWCLTCPRGIFSATSSAFGYNDQRFGPCSFPTVKFPRRVYWRRAKAFLGFVFLCCSIGTDGCLWQIVYKYARFYSK